MRAVRNVKFNVSAYTARLIGRENVSKIEGAILELVKNAYDADAKMVCIYYDNTENQVYIMDNGTGMLEKTIVKHWMTIGNSSKKIEYISEQGRIQTGAKGIGRFALDRMADHCDMITVTKKSKLEWIVDWNDFEKADNISDVEAKLYDTEDDLIRFVKNNGINNSILDKFIQEKGKLDSTGTVFRLSGLRDEWNSNLIEKLRNHLSNLLPPDVVNDFKIYLFENITTIEEAEIQSNNIDSYDYKIEFDVSEVSQSEEKKEGKVNYNLNISMIRNEFEFGEKEKTILEEAAFSHDDSKYFHGENIKITYPIEEVLSGDSNDNIIGTLSGVMYFNKIQMAQDDKKRFFYKDITGRKNLTAKFGGIKLYRDNFRVRPYGESGTNDFDWLELSSRRNKQPAGLGHETGRWHVGAEQILGTINISRENSNLEDDANRNGIQDGEGLRQLKQILMYVIDVFERDRQYVGRKLAKWFKINDPVSAQIEEIKRKARLQEDDNEKREHINSSNENDNKREKNIDTNVSAKFASEVIDNLNIRKEQEIQDLKDEIKMLQTLATTGIITNMFMHEIKALTNNIGTELSSAYDSLVYDKNIEDALFNVKRGIEYKKNFASWFGVTIDSIKKDKRKRKNCDIKQLVETFLNTWENILNKKSIQIKFTCEDNIVLRCYSFDIENIISNLISNSIYSFERETVEKLENKEIIISIQGEENNVIFEYNDTGWGLPEKYKKNPYLILEAFETEKKNDLLEDGTGMGMWIINKTVIEYNGSIDLSMNKIKDMGFYINIKLGGRNDV